MKDNLVYIIGTTDHKVILETSYLSKVVFFGELRSVQDEVERTDDEIIKIVNHLHIAYLQSKTMINMLNFVDAVRDMETEDILDTNIYDIIKLAEEMEYS